MTEVSPSPPPVEVCERDEEVSHRVAFAAE